MVVGPIVMYSSDVSSPCFEIIKINKIKFKIKIRLYVYLEKLSVFSFDKITSDFY